MAEVLPIWLKMLPVILFKKQNGYFLLIGRASHGSLLAARTYCSNNLRMNEICLLNWQDLIDVIFSLKYTSC